MLTVLNVLFLTVLKTGTHLSIEHFNYKLNNCSSL